MQLELERQRRETEIRLDRDNEILNIRLAEAAAESTIRDEITIQRRLNLDHANRVNADLEYYKAREYAESIALQEDEARRSAINEELRRSRHSRLATFRHLDRSPYRSPIRGE